MNRNEYYRTYYQHTIQWQRKTRREGKLRRHWVRWLLLELGIPAHVVFRRKVD